MTRKEFCSMVFVLLFFSIESLAQKQLSGDDIKTFYDLIKQTKEYKTLQGQVDSANNAGDGRQISLEIKMEILKKDSGGSTDDFIFFASVERRLDIGLLLDKYTFQYDKRKKQIVGTNHQKGRFQMK
jgi:hypothetical protein